MTGRLAALGGRLQAIARMVEDLRPLDAAAAPLHAVAAPTVGAGAARAVLGGEWLGHPVHPLLVTAPIGLLGAAAVLDATGGQEGERPAEWLLGFGLLAMAPAVATGLSDWTQLDRRARRVGVVHAVSNVGGGLLAWQSYRLRRRGDRPAAQRWLALGLAAIGAGGYLGGHLTYVLGAGVRER